VIGVFRTLLEQHPDIIDQANEALVSAIENRSPRWVALMLWLGADAHARIKHPKWDDETVSGLEEAARHGLVDMLKKIELDRRSMILLVWLNLWVFLPIRLRSSICFLSIPI
jgi:hypothetical protein